MGDLDNATQEVTITDESTGYKCNPDSAGRLPVLAGQTGAWLVGQTGNWTVGVTGPVNASTVPTIYNVTLVSANTEYSQALPAGCRRFMIQLRTAKDLRMSFTLGESGTKYLTLPTGSVYYEDTLDLAARTLYFQSPTAGVVAEIVAWV